MWDALRLAWRRLRNSPGFVITAVSTLALAVGANTAIFTVADAVLFRPLPYHDPDRLFVIRSVDHKTGFRSSGVPFAYVDAVRQRHSGVASVALRSTTIFISHAGSDGGEDIEMFAAAPDYFQALGVRPYRGRFFEPADAAEGSRRVVITYEAWQRRFRGDEAILGKAVRLGSADRVVLGILPPRFVFPTASLFRRDVMTGRAEFATVGQVPPPGAPPTFRSSVILGGTAVDAIVRLKPGISREQAQAELDAIAASVTPPRAEDALRPIVFDDLRSLLFPSGRQVLALLVISAGIVLLIGCANLANMLLARAHARERDMAIHAALGANRLRLMRPVLFETLLVAAAAAMVAVLITSALADVLIRQVPQIAYGRSYVGVDRRVVAFALTLGVAAGLLFGVVPAWRASAADVQSLLRAGALRARRRRRTLGRPMVAAQIGLSVVLVVGGVAAAQRLVKVLNIPAGFDPNNVLMLHVTPQVKERSQLHAFYLDVVARLSRRGDVVSVGAAAITPFDFIRSSERMSAAVEEPSAVWALPGYLETIGVRLRVGRLPAPDDYAAGASVAVLNAAATTMLFPSGDALGQTFVLRNEPKRLLLVIGIIEDEIPEIRYRFPNVYFVPSPLNALSTIVVRTRRESHATLQDIRRELLPLSPPDEAVSARWMSDAIQGLDTYRRPRFETLVLGSFAFLALVLVGLGVFSLVSATVSFRRRELAVRSAVGASPRRLVRLVLRELLLPVCAGLSSGAFGTWVASSILQARQADFHGVGGQLTVVVILVVVVVAMIAAYVPTRRVSQIDPAITLRAE